MKLAFAFQCEDTVTSIEQKIGELHHGKKPNVAVDDIEANECLFSEYHCSPSRDEQWTWSNLTADYADGVSHPYQVSAMEDFLQTCIRDIGESSGQTLHIIKHYEDDDASDIYFAVACIDALGTKFAIAVPDESHIYVVADGDRNRIQHLLSEWFGKNFDFEDDDIRLIQYESQWSSTLKWNQSMYDVQPSVLLDTIQIPTLYIQLASQCMAGLDGDYHHYDENIIRPNMSSVANGKLVGSPLEDGFNVENDDLKALQELSDQISELEEKAKALINKIYG